MISLDTHALQTRLVQAGGVLSLGTNFEGGKNSGVYANDCVTPQSLAQGKAEVWLFVAGHRPALGGVDLTLNARVLLDTINAARHWRRSCLDVKRELDKLWRRFILALATGDKIPASGPAGIVTVEGRDFWIGLRRLPEGAKIGTQGLENLSSQNVWTHSSIGSKHTLVRYPVK
jgi:hypothetical protein